MPASEFFATLCAPFREDEIGYKPGGGGREYAYVKPRAIMNRLDDVCGPANLQVSYRPVGDRGFTCAIGIRCNIPLRDTSEVFDEWITKEDGGGYADMADSDNSEKSGYTDAFKRAAVAWGIGRYLYQEGVPQGYEDASGGAPSRGYANGGAERSRPAAGTGTSSGGPHSRGNSERAPSSRSQNKNVGSLPKYGKALFAWAKNLEVHYDTKGIVDLINAYGDRGNLPKKMVEWNDEDVRRAALYAAREISGWKCYGGEFDAALREEDEQDAAQFDEPKQAVKPAPDQTNTNNLKRAIVDICKQYQKATGLVIPTYETVCQLIASVSEGKIKNFTEYQDYAELNCFYGKICDLLEKTQAAPAQPADDIPF